VIGVQRAKRPNVLRQHADRWLRELLASATDIARSRAQNKYRHKAIKFALVRMFHGKCAYCESRMTHIDYGHIEHYRPKSKYVRHTFKWANLLLACGICNGKAYKGDQFPGRSDGGPLVNPCKDSPCDHLAFEYDRIARIATVRPLTSRGRVTESTLGLNRKDLREYRSRQIKRLIALALSEATHLEAREELQEAKEPHSEYSAFARSL